MLDANNPFDPPQSEPDEPVKFECLEPLEIAGWGRRFLNYQFDYWAQMILLFFLFRNLPDEWIESIPRRSMLSLGLSVSFHFIYYVLLEGLTGCTIGKLLTGTKVVDEDGNPPSLGRILLRTLARLIPLEFLSFLGTPPRGRHDSLSGTYVIVLR